MFKNNNTGAFGSPVRSQVQGGFVTSPGILGTPLPPNYNRNDRDYMKNVVPVTVAQVWKAEEDEEIKVGNSVAHILALVGKLTFVEKRSASLTFKLDDMTGPPIEVKLWLGFDEKVPDELTTLSKPFPYAHVIAKLRCFQRKRFLHASRIFLVRDANEITMHLLEVIHASMSIKVKEQMDYATNDQVDITILLGPQMDIAVTVPPSSTAGNSLSYQAAFLNSANFSTPTAAATLPKSLQTPPSSAVKPMSAVMKGLSKEQQMVLRVISSTKSPIGVGYEQLFSSLNMLNKHRILQTVEFLINEGHIYNTIDDDHFLATDDELFQ